MPNARNEVSYYPEIQRFIEQQLKSNFLLLRQRDLFVYWGIGELKANLQRIISKHPAECECARTFVNRLPPLNLDIFAFVTDGEHYEVLILEVKLLRSAGLKEWSQLVGYCLVSGAKYGLLVNIENGGSQRLNQILSTEHHLSHIYTTVEGNSCEHLLGLMTWNSLTHNFEYSNLGAIKSLSDLSERIAAEFK